MLTYAISPYKAPHKDVPPRDYLNRDNILARQIERCKVKIGDRVRSTTGKRAGHIGIVAELIDDPSKVEWKKGGKQPYFVSVRFPLVANDNETRVTYGFEIVNFPVKQLRHAR